MGFPGSSVGKESARIAGNPSSIPGSGRPWRRDRLPTRLFLGFPGGSGSKESSCNAGDLGSVSELGRSLGEGNRYPFQYSGLKNSMDRRAWGATVHGITKSRTRLSDCHYHFQGNILEGIDILEHYSLCTWYLPHQVLES